MLQPKYLTKLSLLLSSALLISGCSLLQTPEKEIVIQNQIVEKKIPLQPAPKPVTLGSTSFFVVTEENFEEFIEKYKKENGDPWVFYAMSVRSYETMAVNVAEIRRYLEQQKAIIVYYENAITKKPEEKEQEGK